MRPNCCLSPATDMHMSCELSLDRSFVDLYSSIDDGLTNCKRPCPMQSLHF